jgi:NADH:ubiquinone oxidoreductase subunit 5 (subunit L)/multisubunit Na+/H+ antiporter MnhA subunit
VSWKKAKEKGGDDAGRRSQTIPFLYDDANRRAFRLLNIEWSYQLDPLSSIFMLIVTGVGLCIFVFATGYMHGETGFYRFFAYMGLFMFSMLVLVMGSNFLMMFVGWEGVGSVRTC